MSSPQWAPNAMAPQNPSTSPSSSPQCTPVATGRLPNRRASDSRSNSIETVFFVIVFLLSLSLSRLLTSTSQITGLLVFHLGSAGADIDQLHHPAVFVAQDVAMENVRPRVIYKPRQHLYPTAWRNGEIIPPHPRFSHLHSPRGNMERGIGIKPLHDLKRINVDVERMRQRFCQRIVGERPLFGGAQLHILVDFAAELFAVDRVHRRRVRHQGRRWRRCRRVPPATTSDWGWCG